MTTPEVSNSRPPSLARVVGLVRSTRFSTRLWFDLLAPCAMLAVLRDGPLPIGATTAVLAVSLLLHAASNYHNDLNDTSVDAASTEDSRKHRALVSGNVAKRDLASIGWVLALLSIAVSFLLPWSVVAVVLLVNLLAVVYNFPPLRLAGRPFVLQVFWPVVWGLFYALCGLAIDSHQWGRTLLFAVFIAVFMGVGEGITQDIRDADNDAAGGRRTTPVVWGVAPSVTFAFAVQVLSLVPWLIFAISFPLPPAMTVLGTAGIAVWLAVFARLTIRLRADFDKAAARLTHVGSIYAFSVVNIATCIGGILTAPVT